MLTLGTTDRVRRHLHQHFDCGLPSTIDPAGTSILPRQFFSNHQSLITNQQFLQQLRPEPFLPS
jgi:hypothetical protein